MSQSNQFRIGGVYRDQCGRVVRLEPNECDGSPYIDGPAWCRVWDAKFGEWCGDGYRWLNDGTDPSGWKLDGLGYRHLLPGELHQVNGEWVPIEEKPPLLVDSRGNRHQVKRGCGCVDCVAFYAGEELPNAAMIARDETEAAQHYANKRAFVAKLQARQKPASTAKPALPCLTSSPDLAGEWKPFEFGSAHLKVKAA